MQDVPDGIASERASAASGVTLAIQLSSDLEAAHMALLPLEGLL